MTERYLSRREALKVFGAVAIGLVTGESFVHTGKIVNQTVADVTGVQTGNAYILERTQDACSTVDASDPCVQTYAATPSIKAMDVVVKPPLEELAARALPSMVVSKEEDSETAVRDVLFGTWRLGFTRREFIWGAVSTLMFGLVHNIGDHSVALNIIPAAQLAAGFQLWVLQRKFGYFANTIAHMWNNARAKS